MGYLKKRLYKLECINKEISIKKFLDSSTQKDYDFSSLSAFLNFNEIKKALTLFYDVMLRDLMVRFLEILKRSIEIMEESIRNFTLELFVSIYNLNIIVERTVIA